MKYETLLFDFDHTLFDSNASEAAAFTNTLRTFGVEDPTAHFDTYTAINSALWTAVELHQITPDQVRLLRFEQLVEAIGLAADPLAMAEVFVDGMSTHGELFPEARAVLEHLAGTARLAMITNAMSDVQRARIARLGIAHYFDAIVISSEVGAAKPGIAIFDIAFARLNQPEKTTTLMIGDSLSSDMLGGATYGIATCWYNPHGKTARPTDVITHEISSLTELVSIQADERDG